MVDGGGVVRVAPSDDPSPIVLAAAELGRVLVLHPSQDGAGLVAARLRGAGRSVALLPDGWASAASGALARARKPSGWNRSSVRNARLRRPTASDC